jgi:hypothetical protein
VPAARHIAPRLRGDLGGIPGMPSDSAVERMKASLFRAEASVKDGPTGRRAAVAFGDP